MVGYPVRDYKIIVTITRHGVLKPTSERLHEIEIDPFRGIQSLLFYVSNKFFSCIFQ